MEKNDTLRIESLDQLKGLGIILVVVGHFIEPYRERFFVVNSIFICIYAFHMPLFCLLSGMVAKFNMKKIVFKMGWIYALSQLFYLAICVILDSERFIRGGVKRFIRQFVYPYWHMWYLYAMIIWLLSLVLLDQAKKYIPKSIILFGYIGIMLASGYIHLPLELTRVVVFYVFFVTGYLYKDVLLKWVREKKETACYLMTVIVLIIFFVVIAMRAEKINANILWEYLSYSEGGYTLWERLIFCMVAIAICLLIGCINTTYKNSFLIRLGKNTMPIYIYHAVFVKGFDILEEYINMQHDVLSILGRLVMAILTIFLLQSGVVQKVSSRIWNIPINSLKRKEKI